MRHSLTCFHNIMTTTTTSNRKNEINIDCFPFQLLICIPIIRLCLNNWWPIPHVYRRPSHPLHLTASQLHRLITLPHCCLHRLPWVTRCLLYPLPRLASNPQVIISYRRPQILSSLWWDQIPATRTLFPINWMRPSYPLIQSRLFNNSSRSSNSSRSTNSNNKPVKKTWRHPGTPRSLAALEWTSRVRRWVFSNLTHITLTRLIRLSLILMELKASSNSREQVPIGFVNLITPMRIVRSLVGL